MEAERFYERPREIEPQRERIENRQQIVPAEPIFDEFLFRKEIRSNEALKLLIQSRNKVDFEKFNKFEPLDLENDRRNRRVDEVILGLMRPGPRAIAPQPQIGEPQAQLPPSKTRKFVSSTGFTASTHVYEFPRTITVKGQRVVADKYTEIHFIPDRRNFFDVARMTDSLAKGIQGVIELLDAVDQGKFEPAQLFVGVTNINMALITQRLGFRVVDECRSPDGQIDRVLPAFTVVGRLEDIRTRVEEFKRKGTAEKLSQRSQRLQRMIPQAVG